jgi:hypothetical protein
MTRLILQTGFSGDNDLVSPERGYNGFPGLGSCQIGWGGVRRIVVSLCRSGIKSPSALSPPFLLSRTQNSVLLKTVQKSVRGVLQKQETLNKWTSLAFFRAAQDGSAACHVWEQIAIWNAIKSIPITTMVQANLLFPAVIYKHCLLRRLLLYFPMLGNLLLQICTYWVYGVFEKISTTRNDLRCPVFRLKERELYYMRACSTTVFLPLLTGYDDNATHSCCSRHDHWYTITDQNERQ